MLFLYTVYMQTIDDVSYGVIPLIKEEGVWKVFLINQYGHGGDIYWTFPKGHPEDGESQEEAARRELDEETHIALTTLHTNFVYEQAYTFPCEGNMINKKVFYYLGIAASPAFTIQEDEVKEAGWYSFDDAAKRLTHDRARIMLGKVEDDIKVLN